MEDATKVEKKGKLCPHCKVEVDPKASRCPHCRGKIPQWTLGKLLAAGLFGFFVLSIVMSISRSSAPHTTPAATPEQTAQQAADLVAWQKTPAGKLCAKHPDWKKEDCDKLIDKSVWIGMTYDQLLYVTGSKPEDVHVSDYGRGQRYQYCWPGHTISCFYDNDGDGIIDSYN